MRNRWVLGLHLVYLTFFLCVTKYNCLGAQNLTKSCHERERLALLEFKYSVEDGYKVLSSWVGVDCCLWKGVRCDSATASVVSLHLRGNYFAYSDNYLEENFYYLVGDKVNTYLAELRHLKHLDLSGNYFQGSKIPEFIGSLKQLSYLNLSDAGFNGIIPHQIGNLSNLKVLDLGSRRFTQWSIVSNDLAWISGLSSLEHLDLGRAELSQAKNIDMVWYMLPSLTYLSLRDSGLSNVDLGLHLNSSKILPKIKHLDLGFNNFEGPLPHVFQNMTSLTFLDLSSYNLSMSWNSVNLLNMIPSLSELHLSYCGLHNAPFSPTYFNFSTHSHIQYLDLSGNSIGGIFPTELNNITSLRVLDLSANDLNSSIPIMTNLLKLDVSSNNFEHIELAGIWRQCHLKELHLSFIYFGGEMIGSSSNTSECSQYALEKLDLTGNQLNGSIPESIGRLTNLRVLLLAGNSFTSSIPNALERLRSLEVLDLSYNKLTGYIPESLGRLTGLTCLLLHSNRLTGPIPISVGQLTELLALYVSDNSLEGVVSEAHFANLSNLKSLYTESNHQLIFNLSHDWIPPFQLGNVDLSSCKIAYGFPMWLRTQRKIKRLTLSNANLHGILPTWLRKMAILSRLDLSHNNLTGSLINLPFSLRKNSAVEILILQDNDFNGSIPRSLCRRTNLVLLDVSRNRLSGNIPDCVENLQDMAYLILSENEMFGVLPSSLGNMPSLECLKLNDNNFNGEIPRDLGNLRSLIFLDLGSNEFSGNIPTWIGANFTYLMVLRLHENNFTGGIPPFLCKLSHLHILDLAYNRLTGSIPHCFEELNGMIEARDTGYKYTGQYWSMVRFMDVAYLYQVIKGSKLEYLKTLDLVFNMDLSSNQLSGEIPPQITELALLVGLNLSHNHLSGSIPNTIGNMKALNSLDFSDNQLTGMIPPSMAALNFLSWLNLSHNNLSGRIPTGNQLQTLTDPSMYAGNRDLCGAPLPNNCSNHENPPATTSKNKYKNVNVPRKVWFYLDITCGFATGFWGIIGVLSFKKQWRQKLFMIAEVTMDKVFVAVAVKISKIKRDRE